ncbi:MAG: dipeptide ABC transporter ATP-binding protein [Porticoccaceae bacterium]|nr:ABC transporter ATP-binding protein [Pseudomonadales bacterium]MCP5171715.1 ABC transporter ATP-binding protein [Pseudomonadales bacterium]
MSLLDVTNLAISFHTREGITEAVGGISFNVSKGETLAIVGESGSGKSVACYSLLNLIPQPPGRIDSGKALFNGQDLLTADAQTLRHIRGNDIAVIFQDPMTCLNPYMKVGEQLMEPLLYHHQSSRAEARRKAIRALGEVGIVEPEKRIDSYPHEFSGGMRQRVMIAMALITEPQLLICDEPTTALDVTIQAQILKLIRELQQRRDIGVIFVSHDLAVVSGLADRVAVMKDGEIVEQGPVAQIFHHAQHPYTQKLLASIPSTAKPGSEANEKPPQRHTTPPLLAIKNLRVWFPDHSKAINHGFKKQQRYVKAVDDLSLEINRGEILGLVGESGSGKSTLGRAILQLISTTEGNITFDGTNLTHLSSKAMKPVRRRMQMIFQDPYASLNPRMTVFDTLAEPLLYHGLANRKTVTGQVLALMDDVGLARKAIRKYPHEFSGGQRQRIAIGRAIATKPEMVVADEPVSALDVTIQAQILALILALVEKHNLTMLFISHDLAVVRYIADRIAVMHHGKLVEIGQTESLFAQPQHPYTEQLLTAIPILTSGLMTHENALV